jgi:hypothetical protein
LFAEASSALGKILKNQFLGVNKIVVEQDAAILGKIYADAPKKIRLNNEVGIEWVERNFANWENN